MRVFKFAAATLFAAALVFGTGFFIGQRGSVRPSSTKGPITIGFIGPLSGDASQLGANIRSAVELARDEINAAGGIAGRQLSVIFEDGKCSAKEAANAAEKLLNTERVVAILGGVCTAETLAIAPLTENAQVPLISAASTHPNISNAGQYTFRFVPSDGYQGGLAAEYLFNTLQKKRVAALSCNNDFCQNVKESFRKRIAELGGEMVVDERFESESRDLRQQLTKLRGAKPDAIYFVGYTDATIIGLKQIKELGITLPVFGADTWDDPRIANELKSMANGIQYAVPVNQKLPGSFVDEMKKRSGGKELVVYAARAYDSVMALAELMQEVGVSGKKIQAALATLENYRGIGDIYTMDLKGDLSSAQYRIKQFDNGKTIEAR